MKFVIWEGGSNLASVSSHEFDRLNQDQSFLRSLRETSRTLLIQKGQNEEG